MRTQRPVLLTSFRPWRAHQTSNSSTDLLGAVQPMLRGNYRWLTSIPVSFELAPAQVMSAAYGVMPRAIVCCGMAEKRQHLSLEYRAQRQGKSRYTSVDVRQLQRGTLWTELSGDAGRYVCNHLYYEVLSAIARNQLPMKALFIHIPPITQANQSLLIHDFCAVVGQL